MTKLYTSKSRDFAPKQIRTLLDHHTEQTGGKVVFLEEMHWWSSVKNYWTEDLCGALFWQEKPPASVPGATNWFGYYWRKDMAAIVEGREPAPANLLIFGMPKFEPVIDAVYIPRQDILTYSRHQHDFFSVPGTGVSVDGGRACMRVLFDQPSDYAVVPYNLLTKTFEFKGKTHHVD